MGYMIIPALLIVFGVIGTVLLVRSLGRDIDRAFGREINDNK